MITNISAISKEGYFTITTKVGDNVKEYVIGKRLFITQSKNRKYMLEGDSLEDLRNDCVLLSVIVNELAEIENTYIVACIIDSYVRGYRLQDTLPKILKLRGV